MTQTITPHICVRGAGAAADWYQRAFGARIGRRVPVPGDKFLEIELRFGEDSVMIADEFPEMGVISPLTLGGTYGAIHIAADDVDALWERAIAAGAEIHHPLADMFWGERHGQIIDPFGHRWGLNQHLRDVPDDEVTQAAAALFTTDPT